MKGAVSCVRAICWCFPFGFFTPRLAKTFPELSSYAIFFFILYYAQIGIFYVINTRRLSFAKVFKSGH